MKFIAGGRFKRYGELQRNSVLVNQSLGGMTYIKLLLNKKVYFESKKRFFIGRRPQHKISS